MSGRADREDVVRAPYAKFSTATVHGKLYTVHLLLYTPSYPWASCFLRTTYSKFFSATVHILSTKSFIFRARRIQIRERMRACFEDRGKHVPMIRLPRNIYSVLTLVLCSCPFRDIHERSSCYAPSLIEFIRLSALKKSHHIRI